MVEVVVVGAAVVVVVVDVVEVDVVVVDVVDVDVVDVDVVVVDVVDVVDVAAAVLEDSPEAATATTPPKIMTAPTGANHFTSVCIFTDSQ